MHRRLTTHSGYWHDNNDNDHKTTTTTTTSITTPTPDRSGNVPVVPLPRRRKRLLSSRPFLYGLDASILLQAVLMWIGVFTVTLLFLSGSYRLFQSILITNPSSKTRQDTDFGIHEISPHGGSSISDLEVLPWNPIYRIPDAMEQVGDRSDHYAVLRKETDALLSDPAVVDQHLQRLLAGQVSYLPRPLEVHHSDQVLYDIYNCPDTPPEGYPYTWKTTEILQNWPTDDTNPPLDSNGNSLIHNSLCVFDYQTDYQKAVNYQKAQVPFVVTNDPAVAKAAARWSLPNYMERLLGSVPHRTEYSENNHFMYYIPPPKARNNNNNHPEENAMGTNLVRKPRLNVPQGWKEPTKSMRMTYREWLNHANVTDDHTTRHDPHWYFRLIGCGTMGNEGSCDYGSSEYLFDELPFFQPKQSLYVVEPDQQKGIHCRFGMKGVIAENHFDGSRNSIALLYGSRRYILSHPDQCYNLALYPKGHPSARHSAVDWSEPDDWPHYPQFAEARSNEVVLQPGQVLYLPTNWFHYIVSLSLNYQCNTRSGIEPALMTFVHQCGF